MIQDRGELQRCIGPFDRDRRRRARHQQAGARLRLPGRNRHRDLERPDTNELVDRGAPRRLAREIDDVQDGAAGLLVQMAIDETRAFDRQRNCLVGDPPYDVGDQPRVVRQVFSRVAPIDVGR